MGAEPLGERVAVLLDGEFVRMVLGRRLKRFPTADEIMAEVERILKEPSIHLGALFDLNSSCTRIA